jgi:hypothetical protein
MFLKIIFCCTHQRRTSNPRFSPRDALEPQLRLAFLAYENPPLSNPPAAGFFAAVSGGSGEPDKTEQKTSGTGTTAAAATPGTATQEQEFSASGKQQESAEELQRTAKGNKSSAPLAGASRTAPPAAAAPVMEHRLYVRILPLRCYLSEEVISFAKGLAATSDRVQSSHATTATTAADPSTTGKTGNTGSSSNGDAAVAQAEPREQAGQELYFQTVMVTATDIKIDYRASTVNIQALHSGDFLQMLNIFPLDGLEITLKHVKVNGVKGSGCAQQLLEQWVQDIYANQLHRVISGTAPFRGLSNIGSDLTELLAIPLRDYRKSGGTLKHLRRGTQALVHTVARETLHATQQLTMLVANAITELASDPVPVPVPVPTGAMSSNGTVGTHRGSSTNANNSARAHKGPYTPQGQGQGQRAQPAGLVEGLGQAYHAVSREVSSAAETVIAIPIREYVHTGAGGYVKSVIRAMPIAVLRPVGGVVEGISYAMLGLRNNLDPNARLDEEDVWNVDIGATSFPKPTVGTATGTGAGGPRVATPTPTPTGTGTGTGFGPGANVNAAGALGGDYHRSGK